MLIRLALVMVLLLLLLQLPHSWTHIVVMRGADPVVKLADRVLVIEVGG